MSTSNENTTIAYGDNAVALLNPNEIAVIRCKGTLMDNNITVRTAAVSSIAYAVEASLNTSDYKLTISLIDTDGIAVSSAIVDLPLGIHCDIDTDTYVMTVSLKDTEGNVVSQDTIDFPLESVVVGGDEQDGIVTLTLQNGNTISFEIGDLVDGLATSKEVDDKIANAITTTLNTEV